jgi:predicted membrane-bound spermidine synthase
MYRRGAPGLLVLIYVVIGALVAGTHGYFAHLATLNDFLGALLAILLWPLVLLGFSFKDLLGHGAPTQGQS